MYITDQMTEIQNLEFFFTHIVVGTVAQRVL